ncbi:MAG TPA: RHS repeat-associated core domain-containing protein [Luteimonas sp.]|nr:RHS repeat-associated core domain-containing protein [Luteimonas sp.]
MTIATQFVRRLRMGFAAFALMLSLGVAQAQTVIYYHTDALGSPIATTDATGTVIERTEYEPYGQVVNGPVEDGPGYTGHVSDAQTGLSYMQQRYYDPQIGRFLSVDAVTAYDGDMRHFTRYAYAYNNPYKFTDPDGRCPQCLWGAPIGFAVNVTVQMLMAKGTMSERFSQISWKQVGVATAAGALSGGVSTIASTAATTGGTIFANVVGNAAVGAVATQASAKVEGRTASASEVLKGAALSGGTAGAGAAISAAPGVLARSASAGMTQTERTATANLLQGIKETTPNFKHSNPAQTAANVTGSAVSTSGDFAPLLDDKKK